MKKQVNINITLPKELHKKIRLEAIRKNTTLKELLIQLWKKRAKHE